MFDTGTPLAADLPIADVLNAALAADGSFAFSKNKNGENMSEEVKTEENVVVTPEQEQEVPLEAADKQEEVVKEEPKATEEITVTPETQEVVAEEPTEEPKVIPNEAEESKDTLAILPSNENVVNLALVGSNLDKMDLEDIEKYYNASATLLEQISEFVTDRVQDAHNNPN